MAEDYDTYLARLHITLDKMMREAIIQGESLRHSKRKSANRNRTKVCPDFAVGDKCYLRVPRKHRLDKLKPRWKEAVVHQKLSSRVLVVKVNGRLKTVNIDDLDRHDLPGHGQQ